MLDKAKRKLTGIGAACVLLLLGPILTVGFFADAELVLTGDKVVATVERCTGYQAARGPGRVELIAAGPQARRGGGGSSGRSNYCLGTWTLKNGAPGKGRLLEIGQRAPGAEVQVYASATAGLSASRWWHAPLPFLGVLMLAALVWMGVRTWRTARARVRERRARVAARRAARAQ
ncbi:hypothetical protein [Nocardia goodfellowii]|uniref:DUF3592 domain-containing protein n=1 Tax=Nocardia goodfellowii TaxID=882446 RepID=A0ABS4Q8K2_9NOCA|nr:hypothetical protein [Nocardia goodfellowii]MBP2187475.1 hypothetical protein [Nocardia goodfellowii]